MDEISYSKVIKYFSRNGAREIYCQIWKHLKIVFAATKFAVDQYTALAREYEEVNTLTKVRGSFSFKETLARRTTRRQSKAMSPYYNPT